MRRYQELPQLAGGVFVTDGGLETTLIYHEHLDLPHFAAFHLLGDGNGRTVLREYFRRYANLARRYAIGAILESPTWRSSPDWGQLLGYDGQRLDDANRDAIRLLHEVRAELETTASPMVISGCVGPRGDGYVPTAVMNVAEARDYHQPQINVFEGADADMVTAITMNYADEAIGIVQAARQADIPVAISFTVETDGCLPTGQSLSDAVSAVDAATGDGPVYYMINCAHPAHFAHVLRKDEPWTARIRGLRVNASRRSHAELNEATELDMGDPVQLGADHRALVAALPGLSVLGGCCGTDHRHVEEILKACLAPSAPAG